MPIRNIYESPSTDECVRDGLGVCANTTAFDGDEFESGIKGVGMTVIPAGASIGAHAHGPEEEIYLIMAGHGIVELDGEQHRVSKGDVLYNVAGGTHGLMNDQPEDLVIFAFCVSVD